MPPLASSTPKVAKIKNNEEKKRKKKKKRPPHKSKMITGYIIYASEIRKDVIKKYPDRDFGDISKLVGIEWKNLPQETKVAFEKRAQEQNAKSKAIAAEAFELKKLADAAEERAKEQATAQQAASQMMQTALPPTACNGYQLVNGHNQSMINNQQQLVGVEGAQHQQQGCDPQSPMMSLPPGPAVQQQMQLQHQQQQYQYQVQRQQQQQTPTNIMKSTMQQQHQPLQIIQQQQQPIATTVQYCNNNSCNSPYQLQQPYHPSQSSPPLQQQQPQQQQVQYQRNNIVYKKPATVRLRPKDATTQTEPMEWVNNEPKKPLRFSQKFIDYLISNRAAPEEIPTTTNNQQQQSTLTNGVGDQLSTSSPEPPNSASPCSTTV